MGKLLAAILILGVVVVKGFSRSEPDTLNVFISRLSDSSGANVPHKFTRNHQNNDVGYEQVSGDIALDGDIAMFTAYAEEYERYSTGPIYNRRYYGGFEKKMYACKGGTSSPDGTRTIWTWIMTTKRCEEVGNGWEGEFSFWVSEYERDGTSRINYAICERRLQQGKLLYTRVGTDEHLCGRDTEKKSSHFFARIGPMACKAITNPQFGYRIDTSHQQGILQQISFQCQSGYHMTGPYTLTCSASGHWSSELPTCSSIMCGPPPDVEHGTPSSGPPYRYTAIVSYDCEPGYTLYPEGMTIQCMDNSQWTSSIAECRPVDCGFPGEIDNGDVSESTYTFGSEIYFSCDSGYALHGSSQARCLANGQWSHRTPTCRTIRCRNLLQPEHGSLIGQDFSTGRAVIVQCHTGYRLVGPAVLRCEQDGDIGSWNDDPPVCERITCNEPEPLENGDMLGTDYSYDSGVAYSCNTGFVLRGADRAKCTEEGWDVETPTCEVIHCGDPGTPTGATREIIGGNFTFGTVVKFECGEGTILDGTQALLCLEDGVWNVETPTCQAVHCTPLDPPRFGAVEAEHFQSGGEARFSCFPGYELVGPTSSVCQLDGSWSHSVPECRTCSIGSYKEGANAEQCRTCPPNSNTTTMASFSHLHCMCLPGTTGPLGGPCVAIECTPLSAPENGQMTPCGHSNHDECHFDCDPGFYLQGSRIMKCTASGWTGNPPVCSECPENTYKTHSAAMTCIPCPRNSGTHDGLGTSVEACKCSPGFEGPLGGPCGDVDECAVDNGGCSQTCTNTPGSFYCSCSIPGYELGDDGATCHKNRSCEMIQQEPGNGRLLCHYTEDTNGYVCYITCNDTYFFVSGVNNYITCGSDTNFVWSHQAVNNTARLPACTKEFFVDVDLPITLSYTSEESCDEVRNMAGHIKVRLQAVVNQLDVCAGERCTVHNLNVNCREDSQGGDNTLQVEFNVMIQNPDENAVTESCESQCQRDNMRRIISDAFTLKSQIEEVITDTPDVLNMADFEGTAVEPSSFSSGRPDLLCEPGRVYSKSRLCVPCDAGFHLPDRQLDNCLPCPKGTYQDEQGQTFCKPCLPGSTTLTEGADHPVMCSARVVVAYNITTPAPPSELDLVDYGDELW